MNPQVSYLTPQSLKVARDLKLLDETSETDLKAIQSYFEDRQNNINFENISQILDSQFKTNQEVSVLWSLEAGNELRLGSHSEQAIFLIKWAQEEYYLFHSKMKKYLPTLETDIKENVIRVAQKIQEEEEARGVQKEGYRFMTDILRARLVAFDIEDLKVKTQIFENIPGVTVIKYKPKFYGTKNSKLRNVTINFIWNSSRICELQIRLGDPPVLEE